MSDQSWEDLYHTGPGTLAGKYLRTFWQPVYRSKDIAAGQAVPIRIMSEDFTLYRGDSGTPHVVSPRCAHRGTQLSLGWVEEDCIRCFYHGWKYEPSGQCVEQPGEEESFSQENPNWNISHARISGTDFCLSGRGPSAGASALRGLRGRRNYRLGAATRLAVQLF